MSGGFHTDIGPFAMTPQWMVSAIRAVSPTTLGSTLVVWSALYEFVNHDTGECYPSRAKIAERAGVSISTAERALNVLREVGALSWEQRRTEHGDLTSNVYTLHLSNPEVTPHVGEPALLDDSTGTSTGDVVTRSTSNQKNSPSPAVTPPGFASWWSLYPRKVGRPAAIKAYALAIGKGVPPDTLTAALRQQIPSLAKDLRFCPHPSTWLNQERWDDTPATAKPSSKEPNLKAFR